jgi:hypothetical protein
MIGPLEDAGFGVVVNDYFGFSQDYRCIVCKRLERSTPASVY